MSSPDANRPVIPHLNAIGTAVPPNDVHETFLAFAAASLPDDRMRKLFRRMADRSGIDHRWSSVTPLDGDPPWRDREGFYVKGAFPGTAARMRRFAQDAFPLAEGALADLERRVGPSWRQGLTHLIWTCCTGFYAPGLDLQIVERYGLDRGIARTQVGFMGCNASFNALRLARDVVRAEPRSRALIVNLEMCTLHMQEMSDIEQALLFMIFADGCAASLVSADPAGLALERFGAELLPDCAEHITWNIGDDGFDMRLSGQVPQAIGRHLPDHIAALLGQRPTAEIDLWAVHPGGRTVLDAVDDALDLGPERMAASRGVLRDYGNMSSATVMFVLERLLAHRSGDGRLGCAMGFGPGISVESLLFREAA